MNVEIQDPGNLSDRVFVLARFINGANYVATVDGVHYYHVAEHHRVRWTFGGRREDNRAEWLTLHPDYATLANGDLDYVFEAAPLPMDPEVEAVLRGIMVLTDHPSLARHHADPF